MNGKPHIVIIGGGFGGLYAASYLARSELAEEGARITLLDRKNYFTFTPLLAEVASGALSREDVTYPFRMMARRYGFSFLQDTATAIDRERQEIITRHARLAYDYLIIAVGATPRFGGPPALRDRSLPLVTVDDAVRIRDRVIESLERATMESDPQRQRRCLTFVIAGAGPSGVEVASEIHELVRCVLKPYYPGLPSARVVVVSRGPRILPGYDQDLATVGLKRLRLRGIDVRLDTSITGADQGVVTTSSGGTTEDIPADTLIWAAGTAPNDWISGQGLPLEDGALAVNSALQVAGSEHIFGIGDATALCDEHTGVRYPPVAPIAISQGIKAAANIENHFRGRPLEPYHAYHAGKIVSLGAGQALVDLLGYRITGPIAWWIYRLAYLLKLVGTKNKVRVALALALNQVFERDISGGGMAEPRIP